MIKPTDALANERTYLAYLRTALAFIAFGFVIARFALFTREISAITHLVVVPNGHASTSFGILMALAGAVVGLYGGYRYVSANAALSKGRAEPMPPSAAIAGTLGIVAIALVVAVNLFAFR